MKLNLPTSITVALSAAAGVLVAFLSSGIIVVEHEWKAPLEVLFTTLALFGISPLTGVAFRTLLHLSNGAATTIAGLLGVLQVILIQVHMSNELHAVLAGLIAFAAGLGFAPVTGPRATPVP